MKKICFSVTVDGDMLALLDECLEEEEKRFTGPKRDKIRTFREGLWQMMAYGELYREIFEGGGK